MRTLKYFRFVILILFITSIIGCQSNPTLTSGEGYIEVAGGKVWYRIIGEGNQTPLLLLHGGPGGTSWYLYPLADLSKDRPIILYDQLGSGRSDHNIDTTLMTVKNFVEQLQELKTALGLNKFYLYGHSWGTTLGLEYYLAHPDGIKALIFGSPLFSTSRWIKDADTLIMTLPDSIQTIIAIAIKSNTYTSSEYRRAESIYYQNFILRGPILFTELDTAPANGSREVYQYMWGPSEFISTGTLKEYDCIDRLNEIKIPTLLITGEFDEARPSTVRYFQSLIPNSKFEMIEGAAHATMHDNLQQNLKVINDFLYGLEK